MIIDENFLEALAQASVFAKKEFSELEKSIDNLFKCLKVIAEKYALILNRSTAESSKITLAGVICYLTLKMVKEFGSDVTANALKMAFSFLLFLMEDEKAFETLFELANEVEKIEKDLDDSKEGR